MSRTRTANANQKLLTIVQCSEVFGVPPRSIYDLITRGHLPSVRFPGSRRVRVDRQDLEGLISQSKEVRV